MGARCSMCEPVHEVAMQKIVASYRPVCEPCHISDRDAEMTIKNKMRVLEVGWGSGKSKLFKNVVLGGGEWQYIFGSLRILSGLQKPRFRLASPRK